MSELPEPLTGFLSRCDTVAEKLGIKPSTLSLRVFRDGKTLKQIAAGRDVGVRRLAEAERALTAIEAADATAPDEQAA